ncbi:ROK family protein [Micromonospora sp. DT31]|uniref:ROK family protein n=1 Tax=Micromonospora sp. DT31 TaxID=3393434 RepID=UPI003CEC8FBF
MDVGGTKLAIRAESDHHEPYETAVRWPEGGPAADLRVLEDQIDLLRRQWGGSIRSIGIALPATLDDRGRVVTWPGRPSWAGVDLGRWVQALFPGLPVAYADDGGLAALAEAEASGSRDLLYVGVGTGVGGGMILEGRPTPHPDVGSFEIGHIIVDRFGAVCDCGRRGCVQATASGPAVLRRAEQLRGAPVTFDGLLRGLEGREAWAQSAVNDGAAALAVSVTTVAELLRPSRVLIGGGFAAGVQSYVDAVASFVTELSRPGQQVPSVGPARLGGLSSLYGAVLIARRTRSPASENQAGAGATHRSATLRGR